MHLRKQQQLLGKWLNFTKTGQSDVDGEDAMLSDPSTVMEPPVLSRSVSVPVINSSPPVGGGRRASKQWVGASSFDATTHSDLNGFSSYNNDSHDHSQSFATDPMEDLWEHPLAIATMSAESSVGGRDSEQHHSPRRLIRNFSKSPRKTAERSSVPTQIRPHEIAHDELAADDCSKKSLRAHSGQRDTSANSNLRDKVQLTSSVSESRTRSTTTPSGSADGKAPIESLLPSLMIQDIVLVLDEGLLCDDASIDGGAAPKDSYDYATNCRTVGDTHENNNTSNHKAPSPFGSPTRATRPRVHAESSDLQQSFGVNDLLIEIDDDDGPDVEVYSKKKGTTRTARKHAGAGSEYHLSFESSEGGIDEFVVAMPGPHSHAAVNNRVHLSANVKKARVVTPERKQTTSSWLNDSMSNNASFVQNSQRSRVRQDIRGGHQSTSALEELLPLDLMVMIPSSADPHNNPRIDFRRVPGGDGVFLDRVNASAYELGCYQRPSLERVVGDSCNGIPVSVSQGTSKFFDHAEDSGDIGYDLSDFIAGEMRIASAPLPVTLSSTSAGRNQSNYHASISSMNFDELYNEGCYSGRQQRDPRSALPVTQRQQTASMEKGNNGIGKTSSVDADEQERDMIRLAMQRSLNDMQSTGASESVERKCAARRFENSRNSSMDCRNSAMNNNHNSRASAVSVSTVYVRDPSTAQHAPPHMDSFSSVSQVRRGAAIGPEDISTSEDKEREMIELALELSLQDEKASHTSLSSRCGSLSTSYTDPPYQGEYIESGSNHSRNSLRHNKERQHQPPPQQQHQLIQNLPSLSDLDAAARNMVAPRFSTENSLLFHLDDYEHDDNDEALLAPTGVPVPLSLERRQTWVSGCHPPPAAPRQPSVSLQIHPKERNVHPQSPYDQQAFHQPSSYVSPMYSETAMYDWERNLMTGHSRRAEEEDYFVEEDEDRFIVGKGQMNSRTPSSESKWTRCSQSTTVARPHSSETRSRTRPMTNQHRSPEVPVWNQMEHRTSYDNGALQRSREQGQGFTHSISAAEADESWVRQPSSNRREFQAVETEFERRARVEKEMFELAMQRSIQEL